jgi:hypothetical protein
MANRGTLPARPKRNLFVRLLPSGEIEIMTNSTKLIGLIMTAVLAAGAGLAQAQPASEWGEELPPELGFPGASAGALPAGTMQPSTGEENLPAPQGVVAPSVEGYDLEAEAGYPEIAGLWNHAAPIESTGTWLERGFWYAEADAVILNRMWDRNDLRLAAGDPNVNNPPVNNSSLGFNPIFLNTNRLLILNGALPGRDAAVRTTLGHFLFRDSRNRDHSIEFTAFGAGDWEQNRVITSEAPNGLFVPFRVDGGNQSFDGSTRQTVDYSSHYQSFETNYRVRQRLGADQLVMDPNGDWHRAANSGFEREFLAGLRFMQLEDRFDWQAQDIVTTGADGRYLINTHNNMFGFQLGLGHTFQTSRWSLGSMAKGGVFLNDALGTTMLDFTATDTDDATNRLRENQLSFIGEFKLQGRYHITPNVSLRAAYELMLVTNAALAPSQATFIPEFSYLNTTGDPFYHGASFGIEGYW